MKNQLLKNASILFSGTIVAFIISFLFSIYFRRVLSDQAFADYEIIFRASSILAVVFAGRYGMSIVTSDSKQEGASLFVGANLISVFSFLLCLLVLFVNEDSIGKWLGVEETSMLYLIPFVSLFMALSQNINFRFTQIKSFKKQSLFKIFHRVSEGVNTLSFSQLFGNRVLIISDLLGRGVLILFSVYTLNKMKELSLSINFQEVKRSLWKYREYPFYNLLPALLNTICLMLPLIMINQFYGSYYTSKIGLTYQVLSLPLALSSAAISQVVLQKVSEHKNEKTKIGKDLYQIIGILMIVAFVGTLIISLFGEALFKFVYGEENKVAGEFALIIIFSSMLRFLVSPFSTILPALNRIKISSYWQLLYFTLITTLYYFRKSTVIEFIKVLVLIDIISYSLYAFIIIYSVVNFNKYINKH